MKNHDTETKTEKKTEEPQTLELRTFPREEEPVESVDGGELLERKRQEERDRIEAEEFWAGRNRATRRSGRMAA